MCVCIHSNGFIARVCADAEVVAEAEAGVGEDAEPEYRPPVQRLERPHGGRASALQVPWVAGANKIILNRTDSRWPD